jgi:hypothetical protein
MPNRGVGVVVATAAAVVALSLVAIVLFVTPCGRGERRDSDYGESTQPSVDAPLPLFDRFPEMSDKKEAAN